MVTRICIVLLFAISAHGATYYVATNGNNGNTGTSVGSPWATVAKALTNCVAGDTVALSSGVHPENISTSSSAYQSGSSGSPITISGPEAQPPTAIVHSIYLAKQHYTLRYLEATGTGASGSQGAFSIDDDASNARIEYCRVDGDSYTNDCRGIWAEGGTHSAGLPTNVVISSCVLLDTGDAMLEAAGRWWTVTNCTFENRYREDAVNWFVSGTPDSPALFAWNTWTNVSNYPQDEVYHTDLIQSWATNGEYSTNVVVANNYAINCTNAQFVFISESDPNLDHLGNWSIRNNVIVSVDLVSQFYAKGIAFLNNTFYYSGNNSGHPLLYRAEDGLAGNRGQASNGTVKNNIFAYCGDNPASATEGWYSVEAGCTNFAADSNLVVGTGSGTTKTGFSELSGINGLDPLFVSSTDFRLQSGSPAIGNGADLSSLFTDDYSGASRSAPWDIGAFEYAPSGGGGGGSSGPLRVTAQRATIGRITGP
jgi:hypothetical protein